MMRAILKLVTLAWCVMALPAHASDASSGTITQPQATQNGAVIFMHSGTRTAPPSCGAGYATRWAVDASTVQGQAQLSVLLTAYALRKSITIHGAGTCSIWGDTETVGILLVNE
jgi:hypothetical protein